MTSDDLTAFEGDLHAAIELYQRSIAIHRGVDDVAAELAAAFQLAMAQAGQHRDALGTCDEVIARAEAAGELWNRAYAHWVRAISHLHLGELDQARLAITATIGIEQDFRDGVCTALCIEVGSWVTASAGRAADAAALAGIAAAVWRQIGTSLAAFGPHASADGNAFSATVDEALGPERAAAIRAEYASVSLPEAVRLGLELLGDPSSKGAVAPPPLFTRAAQLDVLTVRERQIGMLIARGLSNKAIATELTISPRTVDGHVERMLRKLDVTSRSQIASWVTAAH